MLSISYPHCRETLTDRELKQAALGQPGRGKAHHPAARGNPGFLAFLGVGQAFPRPWPRRAIPPHFIAIEWPAYPPEVWHAMLPASKSPVAAARIQSGVVLLRPAVIRRVCELLRYDGSPLPGVGVTREVIFRFTPTDDCFHGKSVSVEAADNLSASSFDIGWL